MKRKHKILVTVLVLLLLALSYGIYYVNDYYHSQISLDDYNDTKVNIIHTSNGLLLDGYGNDTALIFYPGAKVEYTSYVPLLYRLSENGVDCFIINMPFNLAILDKDAAGTLLTRYNYTHWYLAGHSLGGAMASEYASTHNENISGLILLAAYPTSNINKPTLSIYGTEDKVLNQEKYKENMKKIETNLTEHVIPGANHAQYAYYGTQENDGNASISREQQVNITTDEILNFINTYN